MARTLGSEILTLMAGKISVEALGGQGIMVSTYLTLFRIYFPIGVAAANRVGNILGKGAKDAYRAKIAVQISCAITVGSLNLL